MVRLSTRNKQVLVILALMLCIVSIWFSWRLLHVPRTSQMALIPDAYAGLIHVPELGRIMKSAQEDPFLKEAVQTPIIQDFLKSRTWRSLEYWKQQMEFQLQSRIDERHVREALGKRVVLAFYPDSAFLVTSVVSPSARFQILWNEWTDFLYSHYDIQYRKYRGIKVATLTTSGGRFYYALWGRLGLLCSNQALFEQALDRYLSAPKGGTVDSITTYIDFTSYPYLFPYAPQLRSLPVRSWRSETHWQSGRWVSEHQLTLDESLAVASVDRPYVPVNAIPDEVALAGFLRVPPEILWSLTRPYISIQGDRPDLRPYFRSGIQFAIESSSHLLPACSLMFSSQQESAMMTQLSSLHGNIRLGGKSLKVGRAAPYNGIPFFPVSWSPALLVRMQGAYAVPQGAVLLGNDIDLVRRQIDTLQGQIPALERLADLSGYDGGLWAQPERFGPVLAQLARVTGLASLFSDLSLPWLTPLSQSTQPLKHLPEFRAAFRVDGAQIVFRVEIAVELAH